MTTESRTSGHSARLTPMSPSRSEERRPADVDRCNAFLTDLTQLCARYGIGISGDAVLFVMEPEDFAHRYCADSESRLVRL
jgi:hypothetical protein